jgi:hypothetical protein
MIKSLVGPLFYLLGAAASWISWVVAFLLYMITPLFFITPSKLRRVVHQGAE